MSLFSDQLKSYMDKYETTPYLLSKATGIERSFLHKIASGTRLPAHLDMVDQIALALALTPEQTTELHRSYQISKLGAATYYNRLAVQGMLSNISLPSPPSIELLPAEAPQNIPPASVDPGHIRSIVKAVLDQEARNPQGFVHLVLQPNLPGGDFLIKLLQTASDANPHLEILHILCFDNTSQAAQLNIDCLTLVIPALLSCHQYEIYYYHDNAHTAFGQLVPFPLLLLTRHYALQLSADFSFCLCHPTTSGAYELLAARFSACLSLCHPFLRRLDDLFACLKNVSAIDRFILQGSRDDLYVLTPEFCYVPYLTPKLCDQYLSPTLPFRAKLISALENHSATLSQNYPAHYYTTRAGILNFLQTGRFTELPSQFYRALSLGDRKQLLNQFLDDCEASHSASVHLYDPAVLSFSQNMVFVAGAQTQEAILTYAHPTRGVVSLSIQETTVIPAIADYFSSLQTHSSVLSKGESIACLRAILNGFE